MKTYKFIEYYKEEKIFIIKALNKDHLFKELYKYYTKRLKKYNCRMTLQCLEDFIFDIIEVHCIEDKEIISNDPLENFLELWRKYLVRLKSEFKNFNY